ncbi:uncharacterized protein B0H18DRAFT_1123781 [Fomitopsis serialis]|uniref:uncharacterized protein n=1 Tax=Fomitopsis serialis TaxID=139415 RepID=UPI00200733D3|nr:uncharacterized protein B0H18DRAFT_1123781 [Neoantrodia serialis]KAH9917190.1 hypothetical protein B0H18DRAFT_1123781 [Neoantrodia serialis]
MLEFADVATNLKPLGALDLPAVLSNPSPLKYFRLLSITDQPHTGPSPRASATASHHRADTSPTLVDAIAGEGKDRDTWRPRRTAETRDEEQLGAQLRSEMTCLRAASTTLTRVIQLRIPSSAEANVFSIKRPGV